MSIALYELHGEIEVHLERIEKLLPPSYKVSLLARCTNDELDDADILLTMDTLPDIHSAIEKRIKNDGDSVKTGKPRKLT